MLQVSYSAPNQCILPQTGATPLYVASQQNHVKVVQLLLAARANVDIRREVYAHTTYLITYIVHVQIHVCTFRSCVLCFMQGKTTALVIASEKNNLEVVKLLLAAGAQTEIPGVVSDENVHSVYVYFCGVETVHLHARAFYMHTHVPVHTCTC